MKFSNSFLSMEIPENWKPEETKTAFPEGEFKTLKIKAPEEPYLIGITKDAVGDSFTVTPEILVIQGPPLQGPLKKFSEGVKKDLHKPPTSKILKFEEGKFKKAKAYEITAMFKIVEKAFPEPIEIRRFIIHTSHKGRLFVMTYTAHETQFIRFLKPAVKAMKSIKLK